MDAGGVESCVGGRHRKRLAVVNADDSAQLPTAGDPAREAVLKPALLPAERTLQDPGHIQILPDVPDLSKPEGPIVKIRNADERDGYNATSSWS